MVVTVNERSSQISIGSFVSNSWKRTLYVICLLKKSSIGVSNVSSPLGEWICNSAVRPKRLSVEISPNKPKQWSPCKWEIKIWFKRENFRCDLRNCNCAPSPQSIINNLSRTFTIWDVGKWRVVGKAEPQPRICNSNFSIPNLPNWFLLLDL